MKVLGISSAIGVVGAGIADDKALMSECAVSDRIIRTEKLPVLIEDVLNKTGVKISDIDAVAVTIGPGSYSGLRGGLSAAKGLVHALKIPIIPVSTLHAIAFNFLDHQGTVAVAVNACREDYNFSLWASNSGRIKRLTEDMTLKMEKIVEVFSKIKGGIMLAGDSMISGKMRNTNVLIADPKNIVPWASNVARIGIEKLKSGEKGDLMVLAPSYSHKPNIREFKK